MKITKSILSAILCCLLWNTPTFALDIDLDSNDAVDVAYGGTNATTAENARTSLGAQSALVNSAGLAGALSDETGTGAAVFGTNPTIQGKVTATGTAVDDDDCTGEQGKYWWDSTDSAFEFCNASSGAPTTIGAGTGDITSVGDCDTGACTADAALDNENISPTGGTWNLSTIALTLPALANGATSAGFILLKEDSDNGTNTASLYAPAAIGSDYSITLPEDSGGILQTEDSTATLTNKTISGGSNTVTVVDSVGMDGSPASDDTYTGDVIEGLNAGEAITQWDTVYFSATDTEFMIADADATGKWPARGVAVATGSNGNGLVVLSQGIVRNDAWNWATIGGPLYLSDTAGGLTQTAPSTSGDCVQVVGWAISADVAYLNFSGHYLEVQ